MNNVNEVCVKKMRMTCKVSSLKEAHGCSNKFLFYTFELKIDEIFVYLT